MNDNYKKLLIEKYPHILSTNTKLDIYDGWFKIIDLLCERITLNDSDTCMIYEIHIDSYTNNIIIHHSSENDYIIGLIDMAEILMNNTCERCGAPGEQINVRNVKHIACRKCEDRFFVTIL